VKPSARFSDKGTQIYEFGDHFLVVCPRCEKKAEVSIKVEPQQNKPALFLPRRLSCSSCGYNKEWADNSLAIHPNQDWYFELPLWLSTPCCGQTLWAYNVQHLDFLEDFVKARLRERSKDDTFGWSNKSLASRLPRWIQSAKNRDDVLKCIARLRNKLSDS
jgi:hypothetical protein